MNTVWIAGLFGLLMLCLGLLFGSSWTVQALDRRLASQRRKLNARHLEMQETGLCCFWGGNLTVSADRSRSVARSSRRYTMITLIREHLAYWCCGRHRWRTQE